MSSSCSRDLTGAPGRRHPPAPTEVIRRSPPLPPATAALDIDAGRLLEGRISGCAHLSSPHTAETARSRVRQTSLPDAGHSAPCQRWSAAGPGASQKTSLQPRRVVDVAGHEGRRPRTDRGVGAGDGAPALCPRPPSSSSDASSTGASDGTRNDAYPLGSSGVGPPGLRRRRSCRQARDGRADRDAPCHVCRDPGGRERAVPGQVRNRFENHALWSGWNCKPVLKGAG